jgi:hypothetical protein
MDAVRAAAESSSSRRRRFEVKVDFIAEEGKGVRVLSLHGWVVNGEEDKRTRIPGFG